LLGGALDSIRQMIWLLNRGPGSWARGTMTLYTLTHLIIAGSSRSNESDTAPTTLRQALGKGTLTTTSASQEQNKLWCSLFVMHMTILEPEAY
jgi:hypothetical protein